MNILAYIKMHKEELEEELLNISAYQDGPIYHYLEGGIEALDRILTRFKGY